MWYCTRRWGFWLSRGAPFDILAVLSLDLCSFRSSSCRYCQRGGLYQHRGRFVSRCRSFVCYFAGLLFWLVYHLWKISATFTSQTYNLPKSTHTKPHLTPAYSPSRKPCFSSHLSFIVIRRNRVLLFFRYQKYWLLRHFRTLVFASRRLFWVGRTFRLVLCAGLILVILDPFWLPRLRLLSDTLRFVPDLVAIRGFPTFLINTSHACRLWTGVSWTSRKRFFLSAPWWALCKGGLYTSLILGVTGQSDLTGKGSPVWLSKASNS